MVSKIKKSGPEGAVRPFKPTPDFHGSDTAHDRMTEALEHIAVALSAIDHNIERIATLLTANQKS